MKIVSGPRATIDEQDLLNITKLDCSRAIYGYTTVHHTA